MEEYGISLQEHSTLQLTRELYGEADIILAMEAWHVQEMQQSSAGHEGKMHTLKGYVAGVKGFPGQGYDVRDPYGGTIEDYRACAKELSVLLAHALPQLCSELS